MDINTIIRNAAQAALASAHPVKVMENGKLVGIVDDEAILRSVVAEEEVSA
jgi:glycine betaine/proline transport system ATP-binding protein